MSAALLDVNVLIALLDPRHLDHERVHAWADVELDRGWATCAITENGFVRIVSQAAYPNSVTVAQAATTLAAGAAHAAHQFWPCELSFSDAGIRSDRLLGPRQVTDTYLLALAVARGGHLVTLDKGVDVSLVAGAEPGHLVNL